MRQSKKKSYHAVIIDDEPIIGEALQGILSDEGWDSRWFPSGESALEFLHYATTDLILLDVWLEGMDGLETLQQLREKDYCPPVVVMSGHGTIETAVKATKLGAADFLEKPLELEKILPLLDMAVRKRSLYAAEHGNATLGVYPLVGESDATAALHRKIKVVAPRHSWVLITGENGTGKEVVARNIHLNSSRARREFVAVNCAAIPDSLIESELFGYSKGAFTHALSAKKGRFELAHRGTLFLDEIGDMSLQVQAKILRILQEQSFERLGSTETVRVDVRVIAATNKDLHVEIQEGRFRKDLFYRLNVIPVHLLPLREREADIVPLAEHFSELIALELGQNPKLFTREVCEAFRSYTWPGNVRELKNIVERLSVLVEGEKVEKQHLPSHLLMPVHSLKASQVGEQVPEQLAPDEVVGTLKQARDAFERRFIQTRLQENNWNISKTASCIGIERSHLHRKLRHLGIEPKKIETL
ncbi:MAG: sigma-54 dependent transcriptional regulator [Zetaproteobacteria bacterium]|nr:sigma-54 dependent transcriptional regulator [Zetaproteobacteria bacterium]